MTLTAEQVVQAEACRRMLDDPAFQAMLDRIVAEAAGRAMFLDDERQREDNRRVVIAINLITGWWDTDRLFCVAVGFLALVFAAGTISGVVLLLLRRNVGRYLIAAGALVALLAFGGVFIAGADIPWIVYTMPVLPVASAVLALLPATRRWATAG